MKSLFLTIVLFLSTSNVFGQSKGFDCSGRAPIQGSISLTSERAKILAQKCADNKCSPSLSTEATVWQISLFGNSIIATSRFNCLESSRDNIICRKVGSSYMVECCDGSACWYE